MAKNTIYKIKINPETWKKYQGIKSRKNYHCIMLSDRFLDDPKVRNLTAGQVLLYLSCLLAASQSTLGECEVGTVLMSSQCRVKPKLIPTCLNSLQSFQLLSYEKIEPLNKVKEIKEKKVKEIKIPDQDLDPPKKISESKVDQSEFVLQSPPSEPQKEISGVPVWEAYRESYLARYHVEPVRNAMVNKICKNIVSAVGIEDGTNLVRFYLTHNEGFYLKVTHSLNILIRDIQPLMTQMKRGRKFTSNDIRQFEQQDHYRSQIERIEKGEL